MTKKHLLLFAIVGLLLSVGAGSLLAQSTATDTTTSTTKKAAKKTKADADKAADATARHD